MFVCVCARVYTHAPFRKSIMWEYFSVFFVKWSSSYIIISIKKIVYSFKKIQRPISEKCICLLLVKTSREGSGNPLQYSCLENPMDRGAWWAAVHGVAKRWTWLSDFTFMHWRRKWQPTPVFLPGESQGRGSLVGCCLWGHTESDDWSDLAAAAVKTSFSTSRKLRNTGLSGPERHLIPGWRNVL